MSALSYPELIKLVGFYNIVEVESYRENVARICLVKSRINKNNYYILHTKNPENGGWGFISKHFELTSEFTRELEEELRSKEINLGWEVSFDDTSINAFNIVRIKKTTEQIQQETISEYLRTYNLK